MGIADFITIWLVTLKLLGIITWPWIYIFLPLLVLLTIAFVDGVITTLRK